MYPSKYEHMQEKHVLGFHSNYGFGKNKALEYKKILVSKNFVVQSQSQKLIEDVACFQDIFL
jgi:hypothetical protein